MSIDKITSLEYSIKNNKNIVELNNALQRLLSNPDFKLVINEYYFEKEPLRLVKRLGTDSLGFADNRHIIVEQLKAITIFQEYLNKIPYLARTAVIDIKDCEDTIRLINSGEI